MPVTEKQFLAEIGPVLKSLYVKHRSSRADYKEAVESLAVRKMPQATETNRARFVGFALNVYDLMKRSGFDPDETVTEMGRKLHKARRVARGR